MDAGPTAAVEAGGQPPARKRKGRGEDGAAGADTANKRPRSLCPHQRRRSDCKECGGAGICPHQRIRSRCKVCQEEANDSMPDGLGELEEP